MNKKLAIIYFSTDTLLIAVCASFGAIYVLNSQVALICSTLIIFASFLSYKKQVKKRVVNVDISEFDEFFDDENETENLNQAQLTNSENLKELKKKLKTYKIPFKFYDFISAFSPLRIAAYIFLILAFFMLLRHNIFEPFSFLAGLSILPLIALFFSKK